MLSAGQAALTTVRLIERLDDLRRRAECARIDARLELGEHASLAPELQRLVREHPFDERFHGQGFTDS